MGIMFRLGPSRGDKGDKQAGNYNWNCEGEVCYCGFMTGVQRPLFGVPVPPVVIISDCKRTVQT
jgi:hypothetical protein